MMKLKLLGKECFLPDSIDNLLWKHYREIVIQETELKRGLDPFEFFSVVSDIELKELLEIKGDPDLIEIILWFNNNIYKKVGMIGQKPEVMEIYHDGKKYKAPSNLEWKSTGQFRDALAVADNVVGGADNVTFMQVMERIFAIYFYPVVFECEYKVEDIHKLDVGLANAKNVREFGSFFLKKLIASLTGIKKNVQIKELARKNPLLVLMK